MPFHRGAIARLSILFLFALAAVGMRAQNSSGTIQGTINDPSGAVIPGATVTVSNAVSGYKQTTTSDANGQFKFTNIPFNPYSVQATAKGFSPAAQTATIDAMVPVTVNLVLSIAGASQTVTVESQGPLVEDTSTYHTDVDRDLFNTVPLESQSSGLSALVTETTPGVAADSNGLFHGLGDHASNSFSIDGEPITDQQSKVFSNQLPTNAVQSLEVIEGAPPAQYGDKTSLVIVATTRSGQGVTRPTGDIYSSYGSFGTASAGFILSYGQQNWGNFVEVDGLNTGRFLDPPEFTVVHDKGNEGNIFDRVDYAFTQKDSIHLDLNYSRSWFQTPNSFDNLNVQNVTAGGTTSTPTLSNVGDTDQRSKIGTYNISPTYTHIISQNAVVNWSVYVRRDGYNYYPSDNPLADLGPANLQTSSISQFRTLTNAGSHIDYTYVHGHQNLLAGAQYEQFFLREHNNLGIVDNLYNAPCVDSTTGNPVFGFSDPTACNNITNTVNTNYLPVLAPYDLTRGGTNYVWFGHADIKELALYLQDNITLGQWKLNLGVRGDKYNGLADKSQVEPRLGVAYNVKPTNTVLSISYARTLETPFNENLVLSSEGCSDQVLAPLLGCQINPLTGNYIQGTMQPGFRNEFHATLQQGFGKHFVASGEYIWKYTHNAFDFSVFGNTPITFPIDWHSSKIPGYALHAEVPVVRGFSAYFDASSVAARFFGPQIAGAGATGGVSSAPEYPFRIDHDEKFNSNTHAQYTLPDAMPGGSVLGGIWGGFNWRYDSGLVAGSTPCYNFTDPNSSCVNSSTNPDGTAASIGGLPAVLMVDNNIPATSTNPVTGGLIYFPLTADQQSQAGLSCNGVKATPTQALPAECLASEVKSSLLSIPAPGTGNNDHNPPRVAPRNLLDVNIGKDNIFNADRYKLDLQLTAINVTNKVALYNFLSTFSGTHFVTPRALTARITLNF